MGDEDWWRHDGTIDWAVNACGQLVELGLDDEGFTISVCSPLVETCPGVSVRTLCRHAARRAFDAAVTLEPPTGEADALTQLFERWRGRGRRDHPARGDD